MAKSIAVLNPKGGTGKTTISTNLARGLQLRGFDVIVIDTDGQTSACIWRDEAGEDSGYPEVSSLDSPDFIKKVGKIESERDFIIIDGAAQDMTKTAACIYAADLVLTVLSPSRYDVWGAGSMMDLIEQRQIVTDGIPMSKILLNRVTPRTKQLEKLEEAIHGQGVDALVTKINKREVYVATAGGSSVYEERNKDARIEFDALIDEVLGLVS